MSWFKKFKEHFQPSQRPTPPVIPSHTAVGVPGFAAEVDPGVRPEGTANLEITWIDLTTVPGIGNGRGSRIAFRTIGRRPDASTTLTRTEPRDNFTCGCTPLQLVGQMSTIPLVTHEREGEKEVKVPSNVTEAGSAERESEVQLQERENQGTVTRRPTASLTEHLSKDARLRTGEDAHGTVQSGGSKCGYR